MHIVHIITSMERGGAQAVLYNLVSHLPNHRHTIIFFNDGPYSTMFMQLHIPVYQIQAWGGLYNPLFFIRLCVLLKRLHPDCIHTVLWLANLLGRVAARILGIPCIASLHNMAMLNGSLRTMLDKLIYIQPARVIAVSQDVADSFIHKNLVNPASVSVITNGVADMSALNEAEIELPGITSDHIVIGAVGRFSPEKRFDLLLHAFVRVAAQEPRARLIILGAGSQYESLVSLASFLAQIAKKNPHLSQNKQQQHISQYSSGMITAEGIAFLLSDNIPAEIRTIIAEYLLSDIDPLLFDRNSTLLSWRLWNTHGSNFFLVNYDAKQHEITLACNRRPRCSIRKKYPSEHDYYKGPIGNRSGHINPVELEQAWHAVSNKDNTAKFLAKSGNTLITVHSDKSHREWDLEPSYQLREKVKNKFDLSYALLFYYVYVQKQPPGRGQVHSLRALNQFLDNAIIELTSEK